MKMRQIRGYMRLFIRMRVRWHIQLHFQLHFRRQIVLCCLLILNAGCERHSEDELAVGDSIPGFQLTGFEGDQLDFRERAIGERANGEPANKVVLINLWATWCRPCRNEMPGLNTLAEKLDPERFRVIGISIDEDQNLAKEFLRDLRISFRNYHDPEQLVVRDKLNNQGLPETLIVSTGGILKLRLLGERDWLDPAAMELLGKVADNQSIAHE